MAQGRRERTDRRRRSPDSSSVESPMASSAGVPGSGSAGAGSVCAVLRATFDTVAVEPRVPWTRSSSSNSRPRVSPTWGVRSKLAIPDCVLSTAKVDSVPPTTPRLASNRIAENKSSPSASYPQRVPGEPLIARDLALKDPYEIFSQVAA